MPADAGDCAGSPALTPPRQAEKSQSSRSGPDARVRPDTASSGRLARTFDAGRSGRETSQAAGKIEMWLPTQAPGAVGGLSVIGKVGDAPAAYFGGLNTSTATNIAGSVPSFRHQCVVSLFARTASPST